MPNKSLIDLAYNYLLEHEEGAHFKDIWAYVKEMSGLSEEKANNKIGQFLTDLTIDGRFASCKDSIWNLKCRYKFKDVSKNLDDYYQEDESDIDPEEESEDIAIEDKNDDDDFDDDDSNDEDEEEKSHRARDMY